VRKRTVIAAAVATAAVAGAASAAIAPIDDYAESIVPEYETVKVLSVGDTVP